MVSARYTYQITMKHNDMEISLEIDISVFLIFELMAAISEAGPEVYREALARNEAECREWWGHARKLPEFQHHPCDSKLPLILFSDGFECYRFQEVEAILVQSLLRNTLEKPELSSFLLCLIPPHSIPDHGRLYEELGDLWAWQQEISVSGHRPWR